MKARYWVLMSVVGVVILGLLAVILFSVVGVPGFVDVAEATVITPVSVEVMIRPKLVTAPTVTSVVTATPDWESIAKAAIVQLTRMAEEAVEVEVEVIVEPLGSIPGTCEGVHDYQLPGLSELSSDDGLMIHVQYGRGDFEYETLLPTGRYEILKPFKFGHVWELGPSCSPEQALARHVGPSIERRTVRKVNTRGYVHWQTLVDDGTLEVIWQQIPVPLIPVSIVGLVVSDESTTAMTGGVCGAKHELDSDGLTTVGPFDYPVNVQAWGGMYDKTNIVIPVGELTTREWTGGAIWEYENCTLDQVLTDLEQKNVEIYVVEMGVITKN